MVGTSRTELLAPAGGLEAGLAAFQHGADAVYLGLKRFSARSDAQNFDLEELDRLLGHARSLTPARRVFVAINTLVLDHELDDLLATLGEISNIGADAVIVQDLGVARAARRHFPELELHASTQLAAHGRPGVETLRDLGFARVTLAREMTLDEIRDAAAVPGVEVESFIHGALCYSYSGLCLFSSQLIGRSGNRGQCAYPCRDRWRVTAREAREPGPGGEPRDGFAFSMKDLALPDHVVALREAGVSCFKIEGRKKGPLYVAAAVDFYRRLLDGTLPGEERPAREADLRATFARPWTKLYLDSHRDKDVADRDLVGHRGTRVGTLQAVVKAGRGAAVSFRTSRPLARHDGLQIEVPGLDRPFGFPVSSLCIVDGRRRDDVFEAPAGSMVEVSLPENYPTLSIGAAISCSSSQEVKLRFKLDRPNLALHRARRDVHVTAQVDGAGVSLEATVEFTRGRPVRATSRLACVLDEARDPAGMEVAARTAFERLGDTRFFMRSFSWRNPQRRFVPVSRLNSARRQLIDALETAIADDLSARVSEARLDLETGPEESSAPESSWTLKVDRIATLDAFEPADFEELDELVVDLGREPLRGLTERLDSLAARVGGGDRLRLGLPTIVRSWEEKQLRAKVAALRASGHTRWELTNVASWSILGIGPSDGRGLDLTSDWPLFVVNRGAARQLREMGVRRVTLSPEDNAPNISALLARLGPAASVLVYEDTPLFVSESCPYANLSGGCPGPSRCTFTGMELTSSHGGKALVVNDRCRSVTLNAIPFNLSSRLADLRQAGARSLRVHLLHRARSPIEARDLWRSIRRFGAVTPGHTGNYDRASW